MCPAKEQYHVECYEPHLWSYRDTSGKRVDWICQFLGVQATSTEARDRGFCLSFKLDRIDGHGHVSVFFIVTTETSLKTRSMYWSIFITLYHLHQDIIFILTIICVCVFMSHTHILCIQQKQPSHYWSRDLKMCHWLFLSEPAMGLNCSYLLPESIIFILLSVIWEQTPSWHAFTANFSIMEIRGFNVWFQMLVLCSI